VHKLVKN